MDSLRKTPIISLLFAVAFAVVPILLAQNTEKVDIGFEQARDEARANWTRNTRLEIDGLGKMILGADWIEETRAETVTADGQLEVRLPPRLMARSQARLDELITVAYEARMKVDPAWRLGVLDANTPAQNYVAHVFVHTELAGAMLCVVVLLLAGIQLERTWGSPVFGAFAIGSVLTVAYAYRLLDASSGVPWHGGAGLAGAILGAYFIRGLGGHFAVPGWVLLPVWLGVETFAVRGYWIDGSGTVPWATLCAAVGCGAMVAGLLRVLNLEAALDARAEKRKASGPNPVVIRAARMRSDGDPYQAFDLIQAAWRDDPKDSEVCETFFSIAVEVGQPEVAAEAILPSLRFALKRGDVPRAIDYWFPLASKECEVELEPTVLVRLGEALLDASHPEEALFSLRQALDAGASSSHATRIVKIARDLDEDLARRAATIALADPSLDPKSREELEQIAVTPEIEARVPIVPPAPVAALPSKSQLDRRVSAEHQVVETTSFPLDLDVPSRRAEEQLDPDFEGDLSEVDPNEETILDESLYAGGLREENLLAEVSAELAPDPEMTLDTGVNSGDVLSHWNDPGALDAGALGDERVHAEIEAAESLLDVGDLETPDIGFDFGLRGGAPDLVDPRDDETDSDFTPMMDVTDELTSPMSAAQSAALAVPGEVDSDGDARTAIFDQATHLAVEKLAAIRPTASPAQKPAAPPAPAKDEFAFGGVDGESTSMMPIRPLKALNAVPVEASDSWLEVDVDERGKTRLPYSRIGALSIAAVSGLGPRPVLILDCVLNWAEGGDEPMKLIRLRSDRFDPFDYADGANPLEALTGWINRLEDLSGATCLPTRDVLEGRFARYASLAEYEREVLFASSSEA